MDDKGSQKNLYDSEVNFGVLVRRSMKLLIKNKKLSDETIDQLTDNEYCKETFDIDFQMLKKIEEGTSLSDQRNVDGDSRYWAETIYINGEKYFICNDWTEKNKVKYENWLEGNKV